MNIINTVINLDVSIYIYIGLCVFLIIGILTKARPKNIKDYSLGAKSFSTPVLIATMAATLIGGGSTIGEVALYYREGLVSVLPEVIGYFGYILFIIYILPKLDKYYGEISIASILSRIYGISVERFAGLSAYFYCFSAVALQVKTIGIIINYTLGYESVFAVCLSYFIITAYSALGGIRSVVKTDVVQFIIFMVVFPTVVSFLLKENGGLHSVFDKVLWEKKVDFNFISYISLFIFGLTPNISPTFIHRLLIGRSNNTNKKIIVFTALIQMLCSVFAIIIAAIAITKYQSSDGNVMLFKVVLGDMKNNLYIGVFAIAMLAIVLSTADSLMNTGAIIFVQNVLQNKVTDRNRLIALRIVTVLSGFLGLIIALKSKGLLEIIRFIAQYYFSTMLVPFIGGLLVNNPKPLMFWTSSLTGFLTYSLLPFFLPKIGYELYVISILMSSITFILTKNLKSETIISKKTILLRMKQYVDNIIKTMNVPETKLGYAIIPMSFFTIVVEATYNSISLGTEIFKIIAGLIGVSFIFIDKIFKHFSQTSRNCYILFAIWYCFPFLASYLYSALPNTGIAFANMVISCTFLAIIFSSQTLVVFMATGAMLGSLTFFILKPTGVEILISHYITLVFVVLYTGMISFSILKAKEDQLKLYMHELTKIASIGSGKESAVKVLEKQTEIMNLVLRHMKAEQIFLKKRAESNINSDNITHINAEELVEILKDYLCWVDDKRNVKYNINNTAKNFVVNSDVSVIYTIIFSISLYMRLFKEDVIKIAISCRNNQWLIKYSLPGLKFGIDEVKQYIDKDIGEENHKEGILNFNLVEKIIKASSDMQMRINKNSLVLKIPLVTEYSDNKEIFNFISDKMTKGSKVLN